NDRYFGFSFMQMKSKNMALYDSIRLLLCHSLYEIYMKEGRTKAHTMQLNTKHIEGILTKQEENTELSATNRFTLKRISSYLLEHISEKTSLDKMSRELGMNKTKLIRQTKATTGYTVQTLHEKLKMELAKSLILEDKLTLAEIAERLGFQNSNYFSNVFKKNTGESPRTWAKNKK
ncbi:MAG: helix-turn-helix transcriptional regulator, partial [Treponema sp.]|nr:helix-turn-helix transcriptional regulator [Treponema sp.]